MERHIPTADSIINSLLNMNPCEALVYIDTYPWLSEMFKEMGWHSQLAVTYGLPYSFSLTKLCKEYKKNHTRLVHQAIKENDLRVLEYHLPYIPVEQLEIFMPLAVNLRYDNMVNTMVEYKKNDLRNNPERALEIFGDTLIAAVVMGNEDITMKMLYLGADNYLEAIGVAVANNNYYLAHAIIEWKKHDSMIVNGN